MKYTPREKETIEKVKRYLKSIRLLNQEKFSLELEYEDTPTPQSIKYSDEIQGGYAKPKDEQITSMMMHKELINKRLELFNEELDRFAPVLYLLKSGQRTIVNTYINSKGYGDMIARLHDCYISESSYIIEIPKICLELSKYLDLKNIPSLEELNKRFNDYVRKENNKRRKAK